ncbi:sulfite exporter TauE/SafE family protein [Alkalicella caledoniensis]|uniref:Sulfite exporter TauE/SafE family protein n=1 Tax=Alkalicella caledoniensis TaxID=2731377 RepID=A0A7G9W4N2_ALKCA|nr:cytochrome c biogenesis protein CcdA [Alkalicella caledoniensis]QNO13644.1 sulfite exporter TauE/SafE family protein [Alkalicella caledoniensis]
MGTNDGILGTYGFIFSLGLLSGVTPCSLPTIMLLASYTLQDKKNLFSKLKVVTSFLVSMILTLMVVGVVFSGLGKAFFNLEIAYYIISAISIIMGLKMMGILKVRLNLTYVLVPKKKQRQGQGITTGIILGIPFAILGAPCTLPVLLTIISYVMVEANIITGISVLLAYGIGRAIPVLAVALIGSSMQSIFNSKFATKKVNFVLGTKLIFVGLYILYQFWIKT